MDNSVQVPWINWESQNLSEVWKKFEAQANFMSEKTEIVKITNLLIWVGEKGQDIHSTWNLINAQAKLLKTCYNRLKEHVAPQLNEIFAPYKFNAMVQCYGEPFENSVTDLKLPVQDCTYDGSDRIVFGVTSSAIR